MHPISTSIDIHISRTDGEAVVETSHERVAVGIQHEWQHHCDDEDGDAEQKSDDESDLVDSR